MNKIVEEDFIQGVCSGDTEKVASIIETKRCCLSPNVIYKALCQAVHRELLDMVRVLANIAGEEIDWLDNNCNLLYRALSKGNKNIMMCLLEAGADINLRLKSNRTLLHYVVSKKWIKHTAKFPCNNDDTDYINNFIKTFCELLIRNGASLFLCDDETNTPLHTAIWEENIQALEILFKYNINPNHMCNKGTPLHIAVQKQNLTIIKMLLDAGALIGVGDLARDTPLHSAIKHKYESIAVYFLENITNISEFVNISNARGETALHFAAQHGFLTIIQLLIDKGADVNCQNIFGSTPIMYAINNVPNSMHYAWLDPVNWMNLIEISSQNCHLCAVCDLLVDNKADVLICNKYNRSALKEALMCNRTCVMNVLLKPGMSQQILNEILFLTMNYLHIDQCYLIRLLVRWGADVNVRRPEDGSTLLHKAVKDARFFSSQSGSIVEYMETLISCAADVNACNKDNQTPLHLALESVRNEHIMSVIVDILLKNGADVFAVSSNGETPLDLIKNIDRKPSLSKDLVQHYILLYLAANCTDHQLIQLEDQLDQHLNDKILSSILLDNQSQKTNFLRNLSEVDSMKKTNIGDISLYDVLIASQETLIKYINDETLEDILLHPPDHVFQNCQSYETLIRAKCKRAVTIRERRQVLESGEMFLILMANILDIPCGPLIDCSDKIFKYLYFNDFRNLGMVVKNVV